MGGRQSPSYRIRLQQSLKEDSAGEQTSEDHFQNLSNELLLHIFGYVVVLKSNPLSITRFPREPSPELTRRENQPLKILSVVCQRWRHLLLADVFKHARVTLTHRPRWVCLCTQLELEIKSKGLRGGSQHANSIIETIHARVETSPKRAKSSKEPETPMDLEFVEDDEVDLLTLPRRFLHWLPSIRGEVDAFLKFVREKELQSDIKSLVVQTDRDLTTHLTAIEETIIVREVNLLWKTFVATLNLSRLVIAAPPSTMAALTSSRDSPDTWAFKTPLHYLCFSMHDSKSRDLRASSSRPSSSDSSTSINSQRSSKQRVQICPHNLRPWTHVAYNEGTMLPGYAHYEWQNKLPSRVLPHLLYMMHRELKSERSPDVQSFEYYSIFPYSLHVEDVMKQLSHFRSLGTLKIQFAQLDYLDDASRLGKGQRDDVWSEWQDCYKRIVTGYLKTAGEGSVVDCVDARRTEQFEDIDNVFKTYGGGTASGEWENSSEIEIDGADESVKQIRWIRKGSSKA